MEKDFISFLNRRNEDGKKRNKIKLKIEQGNSMT